jgi:hypothetical protein
MWQSSRSTLPDFHITYPNQVSMQQQGGRDGFTSRLKALKLVRGFNQVTDLIVIADNDDDPAAKFTLVCDLIRQAEGFAIPHHAAQMTAGKPRVGIYMLPGAGTPGQLETLCIQSCETAWPERAACLNSFVACNGHIALWEQGKQEKMKMRSLISSICSSDPYTSLPHAWSRAENIIPLAHACFDGLAAFLSAIVPAALPLTHPD